VPHALCQLCRKHKELRDSHFLPKSVLKSLRAPTASVIDPITITDEVAISSSKQVKDYVLCHDCEQRFSRLGETWVVGKMARLNSFPLADMVQSGTPIIAGAEYDMYAGAAIPAIKTDQLAYFALSVFWRSVAHRWKSIAKVPEIDLGPYQEPIRQFLAGEAGFPKDVAVWVWLWTAKPYMLAAYFPMRVNPGEVYHSFEFYIPGIAFHLFSGRKIPQETRNGCCGNSNARMIFTVKRQHTGLLQMMTQSLKTARKSEKLKQFFGGPDPRTKK
jgi:hypothetical protein